MRTLAMLSRAATTGYGFAATVQGIKNHVTRTRRAVDQCKWDGPQRSQSRGRVGGSSVGEMVNTPLRLLGTIYFPGTK